MKIIIEESITSTIKTGVGEHTRALNHLIEDLGYDYEIVSNKFVEFIDNATLKRIVYLVWLNTFFLFKLLFEKQDTVVIYTSFLPLIKLKKVKQIGIIHDICVEIFPDRLSKLNIINQHILNFLILKNADRILTVSNTVKDEIVHHYNYSKDKIFVVYNTFSLNKSDIENEDTILKKYNLLDDKQSYLLSVSSMNPNKNIEMLLEAFDKISEQYPNIKLVLTGNKKNIVKKYTYLAKNKNIIITGFLNAEELIAIYKNAKLYIFPSVYEGFGIPLIDAQKFNIPVLCSDIPIFREVGQSSVEYSKLTVKNFVEKINYLLSNDSRLEELRQLGNKNIKRFSKEVIQLQIQELLELKDE